MKSLLSMILICALLFYVPTIMAADTGPETGTVAETINAGGYTYVRLEEPEIWIAAPTMAVSEGDQVKYTGGMEMRDFYSKALDRTFESIFFVQNVSLAGQDIENMHREAREGAGAKHPGIPDPDSVQAPAPGEIPPLADGKTIVGLFAESDQLNEQEVSLRAKVIKVSQNIMGKNWITLQDGTGTEPDNRLLATSAELVSPGDLVIASGILRKDIDIGAGYKYKILLEEATFSPSSELKPGGQE
jgi:hypothetical protein